MNDKRYYFQKHKNCDLFSKVHKIDRVHANVYWQLVMHANSLFEIE